MFLAVLKLQLVKELKIDNYEEFESFYGEKLVKYGDIINYDVV